MIEDDTNEGGESTTNAPLYRGEVDEMRARGKRYQEMRYRLVVLLESVTAAAEDFRVKAKSERTEFDSFTASMEGLAQKIALGSSALSHQAFAVQIQNILDGRDP